MVKYGNTNLMLIDVVPNDLLLFFKASMALATSKLTHQIQCQHVKYLKNKYINEICYVRTHMLNILHIFHCHHEVPLSKKMTDRLTINRVSRLCSSVLFES